MIKKSELTQPITPTQIDSTLNLPYIISGVDTPSSLANIKITSVA
jgi:hypothetical protein